MVRGSRVGLFAGIVILLACSGCRSGPDDEMVPPPTVIHTVVTRQAAPMPTLPTGPSRFAKGVQAQVSGGVIRIGRRTIDVSPMRADQAVSTSAGVFFLNAGELWFTSGSSASSTGFEKVERLVVSTDGRYLGFVDRNHGPAQPGRTQLAAAVVYDTTTGRVVVRSYAGMGHLGEDLARIYTATPPVVTGFDGEDLVARTPAGVFAYPIDGAKPTPLG